MISASARRLSVFKAVVEEGGFNRAAMRLDISQPSVGAHVKALEHLLAGKPSGAFNLANARALEQHRREQDHEARELHRPVRPLDAEPDAELAHKAGVEVRAAGAIARHRRGVAGQRGAYSWAWVGLVTGVLGALAFSLAGFFLTGRAPQRDAAAAHPPRAGRSTRR